MEKDLLEIKYIDTTNKICEFSRAQRRVDEVHRLGEVPRRCRLVTSE